MENSQSLNGLGSGKENNQQKQNEQDNLPIKEVEKTTAVPSVIDDEDSAQKEQPEQIKQHDYITPEVFIKGEKPSTSRGQNENMNYGKEDNRNDKSDGTGKT